MPPTASGPPRTTATMATTAATSRRILARHGRLIQAGVLDSRAAAAGPTSALPMPVPSAPAGPPRATGPRPHPHGCPSYQVHVQTTGTPGCVPG